MKTEITYQFEIEEGFHIQEAFLLDKETLIVFTSGYPEKKVIHVIGKEYRRIDCSEISSLTKTVFYKVFFKYKNGFGIFDHDDTLVLWNDYLEEPITYKVKIPFSSDKHGRKPFPIRVNYNEQKDIFMVVLEDFFHKNSGRYWSTLELNNNAFHIFKKSKDCSWKQIYSQLRLNDYPLTQNSKYPDTEWLNIKNLLFTNENIFVHTNGGGITRLKCGPSYEFNIMGKYDLNGNFIERFDLEFGVGSFTSDKKFFVLHNHKNKKRLSFYDLKTFDITDTLSLTPKQNVGTNKTGLIHSDFVDDTIIVYHANFLNLCKVI